MVWRKVQYGEEGNKELPRLTALDIGIAETQSASASPKADGDQRQRRETVGEAGPGQGLESESGHDD